MGIATETAAEMLDRICDRIQDIDVMITRIKHSSHVTVTSNIDAVKKQELFNEYNLIMLELYDELQNLEKAHSALIKVVEKDMQ